MVLRSSIFSFLWRLTLGYALLMAPWPGFNRLYSRCFQTLGQVVFSRDGERSLIRFEAVPASSGHVLDTRVVLSKYDLIDRHRVIPEKYLELDARAVGWVPAALILALILSTPLSWRRRGWALLLGMLAIHGFILFSVAVSIWNVSPELSPITLTPFWKWAANGLEETLITQMGASFVAPVLLWILVTLRRQDLIDWQGPGDWKSP